MSPFLYEIKTRSLQNSEFESFVGEEPHGVLAMFDNFDHFR